MPSAHAERLFLLDTNSYLRLADSFHPLIATIFGDPPCKLRVVPDLDRELRKSPRLSGKFHWASSPVYAEDRRHYLRVSAEKREEIETSLDYIRETARDMGLGLSSVDLFCLAYALALDAVVVTDDGPMRLVGAEYEIPLLGTIDLLKLLYDEGRATSEEIEDSVAVMEARNDIPEPKEFWKKYRLNFSDGDR